MRKKKNLKAFREKTYILWKKRNDKLDKHRDSQEIRKHSKIISGTD